MSMQKAAYFYTALQKKHFCSLVSGSRLELPTFGL
jgi:hypothetical protein